MSTATATKNIHGLDVFQSRWGWHYVNYAGYLEVRRLHRLALADYAATRRRDRWRAKLPHNRVRKDGSAIAEPKAVGTTRAEYFRILGAYRDVRTPRPDPDLVATPDLPRGWRERAEHYAEVHEAGERPRAD